MTPMWQTSTPVEISGPTHPIIPAFHTISEGKRYGEEERCVIFAFGHLPDFGASAYAADELGAVFADHVSAFRVDPAWSRPTQWNIPEER